MQARRTHECVESRATYMPDVIRVAAIYSKLGLHCDRRCSSQNVACPGRCFCIPSQGVPGDAPHNPGRRNRCVPNLSQRPKSRIPSHSIVEGFVRQVHAVPQCTGDVHYFVSTEYCVSSFHYLTPSVSWPVGSYSCLWKYGMPFEIDLTALPNVCHARSTTGRLVVICRCFHWLVARSREDS